MRRRRALARLIVGALLVVVLCGAGAARVLGGAGRPFTGTIAVGVDPTALAVDARTGHVFVVNKDDGTVSVLDAARGTVLHTVTVGTRPVAVAVDARRSRAFVVNSNTAVYGSAYGPGTVSVLDTRTGALLRTVTVGTVPATLAVDERTDRVFVANAEEDTVSVLDAARGRVVRTVTAGLGPSVIGVDMTWGRVFVGNAGSGTVQALDAASGRVLRVVTVGSSGQGPVSGLVDAADGRVFVTAGGYSAGPLSILDAHTGSALRSAPSATDILLAVDARRGRLFTLDGATGGVLTVRDARTGVPLQTSPWSSHGALGFNSGRPTVATGDGRAFVATWGGTVLALDMATGRIVRRLDGGAQISAIAVAARTEQVFVANLIAAPARTTGLWAWLPSWARSRLPWLAPRHTPVGTVTVLDGNRS
jgi:YVTN family beta-propeller protein